MTGVNFQRTYMLGDAYEGVDERARRILHRYLGDPRVYSFSDREKSITFTSERLIPAACTHRPRVMLLFSNPHPTSIRKGMFLSPNLDGRPNLFWSAMIDAGWITFPEENPTPQELAEICLNVRYDGPFELIFYCYYAFPTPYPEDIRKIYGKEYLTAVIEPEAMHEFRQVIRETSVEAVVTFNKGIFNLVAQERIERYIERLMGGEVIRSQIDGMDRTIPIYLSYPTGWRYHRQHRQFHVASLETIRTAICRELKISEAKATR